MLTDLHNKPVKPKPIPLPYPLRSHPTQGPSYSKAISSKRTGGRRVPLRGWANGVIGSIPTSCDLGESTKSMGGRKKGMLGLESFHPAKSGWHSLYILELEFLFHNSKTHLIQKSHGKKISQKSSLSEMPRNSGPSKPRDRKSSWKSSACRPPWKIRLVRAERWEEYGSTAVWYGYSLANTSVHYTFKTKHLDHVRILRFKKKNKHFCISIYIYHMKEKNPTSPSNPSLESDKRAWAGAAKVCIPISRAQTSSCMARPSLPENYLQLT